MCSGNRMPAQVQRTWCLLCDCLGGVMEDQPYTTPQAQIGNPELCASSRGEPRPSPCLAPSASVARAHRRIIKKRHRSPA